MTSNGGTSMNPGLHLLTVCSANVCRSPVAAFTLEHNLGPVLAAEAGVRSAGIEAVEGRPMCATAVASITAIEGGAEFCARHRSRLADPALVAAAGLVLTATVRQRSAIVRMYPPARTVAYTQREALALLEAEPSDVERELFNDVTVPFVTRLAELLNMRRGTVVARAVAAPGYRLSLKPHDWDIPDAHLRGRFIHRRAILATAVTATQFAGRLRTLSDASAT
jgi:protein-tyrosine phosphatase